VLLPSNKGTIKILKFQFSHDTHLGITRKNNNKLKIKKYYIYIDARKLILMIKMLKFMIMSHSNSNPKLMLLVQESKDGVKGVPTGSGLSYK
jgi:hypothetical protein